VKPQMQKNAFLTGPSRQGRPRGMSSGSSKPPAAPSREEKLAAALRANLRRRKAAPTPLTDTVPEDEPVERPE